ncbi:hypothetical protein OMP38_33125 [Cohnella ginsengisoli]|uniref:LuxR family transcriptional regulator n=1 Tax=Cohnella ginsengisoli TaxID=425004 RepID=A0A9X4KPE6_9BACL|nr:hypothetical protein [Cohnella ginsengisoli]MDG0795129.1 hypothetical protein [Cohnella ginsengisoli]
MIVKTKLYIPHVRNALVPRPRLMRQLDEGLGAKLTLISAPAGYGKTTALGEWARQCGIPVAWLSLDKQDDEWIPFWSCVTASIGERIPGFAQTVWPLLEKGPSATSVSLESAISAMLNELNRRSGELAIVLDDYHVIELPAIQKSLSYLLEHLPPSHPYLYRESNRLDVAYRQTSGLRRNAANLGEGFAVLSGRGAGLLPGYDGLVAVQRASSGAVQSDGRLDQRTAASGDHAEEQR